MERGRSKSPPCRTERDKGGAPSGVSISVPLAVASQVTFGFAEQAPGFAVALVFVAVLLQRGYGIDREADFDGWLEDYGCGDQIPGCYWDDVSGEEVDVIDGVGVLGEVVAAELAEVSGTVAHTAGFDLHSQQTSCVFDAEVVFQGIAPGFEYVIAVCGGCRHE